MLGKVVMQSCDRVEVGTARGAGSSGSCGHMVHRVGVVVVYLSPVMVPSRYGSADMPAIIVKVGGSGFVVRERRWWCTAF